MRMAAKAAMNSKFEQHRVGAVIVKGGNILATGFNSRQPSSLLGTPTRHAEGAAILTMLKEHRQHDLVGSSIYVTRFTRGGRVGLSRPCDACMGLIRAVGIRNITYTTDTGLTETIKI